MAVVHLNQVGSVKGRFELFNEKRSVVGGNTEGNGCTNVAKNCIANAVGHLGDVLVCNSKVQTIFPSFRKNNGERVGCEVLKLVDIKVEWATIANVRDVGTAHSGELDFRDEEGAENTGIIFANEAFRKVYDKNLPLIHDFSDIEAGFWLADDVTDNRVGCESTDLI